MSYDFGIEIDTGGPERHHIEPFFSDEHPAFDGDHPAGNVVVTSTGYARCGNYTSNVSPMWRECLSAVMGTGESVGLGDLADKKCGDILPHLTAAVEWGVKHIDRLREMNPKNGWGDAEGAVTYLWDIQRMCEAHPDGYLYISR